MGDLSAMGDHSYGRLTCYERPPLWEIDLLWETNLMGDLSAMGDHSYRRFTCYGRPPL